MRPYDAEGDKDLCGINSDDVESVDVCIGTDPGVGEKRPPPPPDDPPIGDIDLAPRLSRVYLALLSAALRCWI